MDWPPSLANSTNFWFYERACFQGTIAQGILTSSSGLCRCAHEYADPQTYVNKHMHKITKKKLGG